MIANEDLNGRILYEDDTHKFIWLGADEKDESGSIQTNQYLIINDGKGVLLDPGGIHLFARVVSIVSRYISIENIESILFSHQDPDVSSGIALWLGVTRAQIYISHLWTRFLPHFGIIDQNRITGVNRQSEPLTLTSGDKISFVPSHFMHSPGQYSFFDHRSGILFTSDIGAAVFQENEQYLFVDDFSSHLPLIEGFHKRYMANNDILKAWVKHVRRLHPKILAPQHGAIYLDDNVDHFLDWLNDLSCGSDIIDTIY